MDADLCVRPGWIVPVVPRGQVLTEHALVVTGGRITAIIPSSTPVNARDVIDLPGHVLLPGFINAHTHAAMTLFRGLADDLPLDDWLGKRIWPAEKRFVNGDFVSDGTALAAVEMIKGGTTCFSDMYFFPGDAALVARRAGLRATLGLVVMDTPTAWAQNGDEYLSRGLALHDSWRHDSLLAALLAPHAPYSVDDQILDRIRISADELDIGIHMHVHETADEVARAMAATGERPLARLDRLGLVNNGLVAVHMTQLTAADMALCAQRGVSVVHCPESNLKIAAGICPITALLRHGVNVALGTDGAASNNDLDMLSEMRMAALLAKGTSGDARAVPAAVALEMATINGARALGLAATTGSLEVGKSADMIAIDLKTAATLPVYDPISQIVYAASRDQVTDVWVAGRALLRARQLQTLDEGPIGARADAWRDKIAAYQKTRGHQ